MCGVLKLASTRSGQRRGGVTMRKLHAPPDLLPCVLLILSRTAPAPCFADRVHSDCQCRLRAVLALHLQAATKAICARGSHVSVMHRLVWLS
jgi:hypothetical protein